MCIIAFQCACKTNASPPSPSNDERLAGGPSSGIDYISQQALRVGSGRCHREVTAHARPDVATQRHHGLSEHLRESDETGENARLATPGESRGGL